MNFIFIIPCMKKVKNYQGVRINSITELEITTELEMNVYGNNYELEISMNSILFPWNYKPQRSVRS